MPAVVLNRLTPHLWFSEPNFENIKKFPGFDSLSHEISKTQIKSVFQPRLRYFHSLIGLKLTNQQRIPAVGGSQGNGDHRQVNGVVSIGREEGASLQFDCTDRRLQDHESGERCSQGQDQRESLISVLSIRFLIISFSSTVRLKSMCSSLYV